MNKKDMCEMYEKMQEENYGYRKGVEEEKKKRTEQLEYIRVKIERLIEICPETVILMPLMDLFNEIGLMKNDIWEKLQ